MSRTNFSLSQHDCSNKVISIQVPLYSPPYLMSIFMYSPNPVKKVTRSLDCIVKSFPVDYVQAIPCSDECFFSEQAHSWGEVTHLLLRWHPTCRQWAINLTCNSLTSKKKILWMPLKDTWIKTLRSQNLHRKNKFSELQHICGRAWVFTCHCLSFGQHEGRWERMHLFKAHECARGSGGTEPVITVPTERLCEVSMPTSQLFLNVLTHMP